MESEFDKFLSLFQPLTPFSIISSFRYFPQEMCNLVFNDYIQHQTTHDSIFATVITAILENQINPSDIFHKSCIGQDSSCVFYIYNQRLQLQLNPCCHKIPYCYTYNIRTISGRREINFQIFKDHSLDMFLDLLFP